MRFRWDPAKSALCRASKGHGLDEVAGVVKNEIGGGMLCDDPEQFLSIGFIGGGNHPISVAYEFRTDAKGVYTWLVTYWKTTQTEMERYDLCKKNSKKQR